MIYPQNIPFVFVGRLGAKFRDLQTSKRYVTEVIVQIGNGGATAVRKECTPEEMISYVNTPCSLFDKKVLEIKVLGEVH
jgi:hypothetical protein